MKFNKKYKSLLMGCTGALVVTSPAFAQLEEIVVTAQKRAESLQYTPIAITALSAGALLDKGVQDISELAQHTPNLVFDTTSPISGLSSGAAVFIRGIGNTDFSLTTDPGVGTYVDGVYVSRSVGGVLDVLDVERIEVLRGPQGTLFGRNTIGGALNIVSRKPAEELEGSAEVTVGNDGRFNFRGSVDVPFSDTVRSSLSFSHKERDGYVERPLVGDTLGSEDRQSVRGTLVFEPNESWDFQFSADYTQIDEESAAAVGRGFTSTFPDGTPGGGGVIGYALTAAGLAGTPRTAAEVAAAVAAANLDQYVTFPLSDGSLDEDDYVSFGTGDVTGVNGSDIEVSGVSLVANYHADNVDVKYTFAKRDTEGAFFSDPDHTPVSITEVNNPVYDHEQTTHEIQLTGTAFSDSLKYVAGAYSFNEEGSDTVLVPIHTLDPGALAGGVFVGFPAGLTNIAAVENDSTAAYFQIVYDINDMWSITAGARRTEDDKEYAYTQYLSGAAGTTAVLNPALPGAVVTPGGPVLPGLLPLVGNGTGVTTDTFEETTGKLGIDAKLADGTLVYYSFSQGFKSGGFVLRYVQPVADALSFEPETLDTHELGIKWQGFEDRLRVNAALFSSKYEEIQVTFYDPLGGPVTANAGTADINGIELELTAVLSDNLQLEVGYGYTDAEYTEINPVPNLSAAITLDSKLVNTPENTLNIGFEYSSLLAGKDLIVRLDYSYVDDIFNDSQNSIFLFQEAVELWNASGKLSLSENSNLVLWVDNIADERYITSGNSNFGLGFHSATVSKPREYGVTYRHNF